MLMHAFRGERAMGQESAGAGVMGLTRTMRDCMLVIQEFADSEGRMPSYGEMARELDVVSRGNIVRIVEALVERGYLRRGMLRRLVIMARIPAPPDEEFVGLFDPSGELLEDVGEAAAP
jgi:hypothetical protein